MVRRPLLFLFLSGVGRRSIPRLTPRTIPLPPAARVVLTKASNENISPVVMRRVLIEIGDLLASPPEDIKLIPCEEDITDIQAIISGPQGTPYEGGHFRVKLKLGSEFPSVPPKGFFLTKIFHPNISATGEICLNTLKRDWREDLGIKHLLLVC